MPRLPCVPTIASWRRAKPRRALPLRLGRAGPAAGGRPAARGRDSRVSGVLPGRPPERQSSGCGAPRCRVLREDDGGRGARTGAVLQVGLRLADVAGPEAEH